MDTLTTVERSERMSRVKGKGSVAERRVRSLAPATGFPFPPHGAKLPGKPDLVFASRRKAIFVHGCFWHRHPDETCRLARLPKSRRDFWIPTLGGDRTRDLGDAGGPAPRGGA